MLTYTNVSRRWKHFEMNFDNLQITYWFCDDNRWYMYILFDVF